MPLFQTDYAVGKKTVPNSQGDEIVQIKVDFAVSAAMLDSTGTVRTNFAANDIIELCELPAGHVPVDVEIAADDIDSNGAPAVTLNVGILNAGKTDFATDVNGDGGNISGQWLASNSTVAQAGGVARRGTAAGDRLIHRVKPLESSRKVGFKVPAAPATLQAGTLSLIFSFRAAHYGA